MNSLRTPLLSVAIAAATLSSVGGGSNEVLNNQLFLLDSAVPPALLFDRIVFA